jgi:hypothetical protein
MPCLFALTLVHLLDLHAVFLGPAHIHAPQDRGPVLALGSAFAGIDLDIGIIAVGLAGQQRSEFGFFGTRSGARQGGFNIGNHVVVAFGQLKQLTGVFGFFFERFERFRSRRPASGALASWPGRPADRPRSPASRRERSVHRGVLWLYPSQRRLRSRAAEERIWSIRDLISADMCSAFRKNKICEAGL